MPVQIYYTVSTTQDVDGNVLSPADPTIAPDGSPGDVNTQVYGGPLRIGQPTRIKALAVKNAGLYSSVTSVYYSKLVLPPDKAEPVGFLPGSKTGPEGTIYDVKLSTATTGATIWYVISPEGSILDPLDASGSSINGSQSIANGGTITVTVPSTVTCRAIKTTAPVFTRSDLTTAQYTVLPPPTTLPSCTFNPPGGSGTIDETILCTVTNSQAGVSIYYIVDPDVVRDPLDSNGNPLPFAMGPINSGDSVLVGHPSVLSARAVLAGYLPSPNASARRTLIMS